MVEPETDAGRFWRFALRAYLPEGNQALFLRLQDESGMDVPLALFCLWCGAENLALSDIAMQAALDFSIAWRTARVEPLRAMRREWKRAVPGQLPSDLAEQARHRLAQAEQAVERLQMDHLVMLRDGIVQEAGATRANLVLYRRLAGLKMDAGDLDRLASMV